MKLTTLSRRVAVATTLSLIWGAAGATEIKRVQAPARAMPKPDLIVYLVDQNHSAPDMIRVTVRNIGNAKSDSAVLLGKNMTSPGQGEASIPSLEPNKQRTLDLKLSAAPKKGDRVQLTADSKNHVAESNETNNSKYISY